MLTQLYRTRIDTMSAKADGNEAAIQTEATTRASEDGGACQLVSIPCSLKQMTIPLQSQLKLKHLLMPTVLSTRIDAVLAKTSGNEVLITKSSKGADR